MKTKAYERVGGVIRDSQTKHIVAMLREAAPNLTQASTILSQFGSGASILNLGVSVIGFALVINRLEEIEQRLKLVEKDLKQLNRKFDISVYANFRAALDLARDAFTMTKPENRVNMANLAINRFLEAQHTYVSYLETALEDDIQIADKYLSSLFLTYVAKARCYLELEEIDTASRCLQESAEALYISLKKYVYTIRPYLENEEQDKLCKSYPELFSRVIVTEPPGGRFPGGLFPSALFNVLEVAALMLVDESLGVNSKNEEKPKFPNALKKIEAMIETHRRFEAYQAEIQAIAQLKISFHEWLKLSPSDAKPDSAELMYIIPSKPLELQPSC